MLSLDPRTFAELVGKDSIDTEAASLTFKQASAGQKRGGAVIRHYDLSAHGDIEALILLVETADANSLPETYEVKVTVAFMRGLLGCIEDLQAAAADRSEGER